MGGESVAGEIAPRALYRIPTLGGPAQRILDDVTWVRVSPDGGRLAYVKMAEQANLTTRALCTASVDGTDERCLATRKAPERLAYVAWSPDGRRIATLASAQGDSSPSILIFGLATGRSRSLAAGTLRLWASGLAWLPDGFLVAGAGDGGRSAVNESQLWLVSDPEGQVRRVTHDLNTYSNFSVTADGRTIVANQDSHRANLWVVSSDAPGQSRAVTVNRRGIDGIRGLDWSRDGRRLAVSRGTTASDLVMITSEEKKQDEG